jgi:hypothetical protein
MPSQGYERVRCLLTPRPACSDAPSLPAPTQRHSNSTDTPPQVAANDDDDSAQNSNSLSAQQWPPASPPPSFHSRPSSPSTRRLLAEDPESTTEDRTLADTFDSDSDDDDDEDGRDDRQRLMRGNPQPDSDDDDDNTPMPGIQRRVTELPVFNTQAPTSGRVYGGGNGGVWANLSAKPTRGEDAEEKPPVRAMWTWIRFCSMS